MRPRRVLVGIGLLIAVAGCSGPQTSSPRRPATHGPARVPERIRALTSAPASAAWDTDVKAILLEFDADRSGWLDAPAELPRGCAVWSALDEAVRDRGRSPGLWQTYGFPSHLTWVGRELGIHDRVRKSAERKLRRCRLAHG